MWTSLGLPGVLLWMCTRPPQRYVQVDAFRERSCSHVNSHPSTAECGDTPSLSRSFSLWSPLSPALNSRYFEPGQVAYRSEIHALSLANVDFTAVAGLAQRRLPPHQRYPHQHSFSVLFRDAPEMKTSFWHPPSCLVVTGGFELRLCILES